MNQKISAAKVTRQREKMIRQINQMEENYRIAAVKYLNKQIELALFRLEHNKTIKHTEFMAYPPLYIDDVTEELRKKLKSNYLSNVQILNDSVMLISISKKEK